MKGARKLRRKITIPCFTVLHCHFSCEYAFILCPADLIEPSHLPSRLLSGSRSSSRSEIGIEIMNDQRSVLMDALKKAGGNQTLAARILGVSRITVWKKMKALGIDSGDIKCSKG